MCPMVVSKKLIDLEMILLCMKILSKKRHGIKRRLDDDYNGLTPPAKMSKGKITRRPLSSDDVTQRKPSVFLQPVQHPMVK